MNNTKALRTWCCWEDSVDGKGMKKDFSGLARIIAYRIDNPQKSLKVSSDAYWVYEG